MSEAAPPIGTLTDRIQFKRRELLTDDTEVFVPVTSLWARVRALAPDKPGDDTHSVVVRYRSDINEGDRVIYRGRTLDVTQAGDLNGRRAYLAIRAREVLP